MIYSSLSQRKMIAIAQTGSRDRKLISQGEKKKHNFLFIYG